jgi:hypothetical protein
MTKRTNNDLQNTTQKIEVQATRTPLNIRDELSCEIDRCYRQGAPLKYLIAIQWVHNILSFIVNTDLLIHFQVYIK